MKRWGVRMLVVGTVLVCLGTAGYAGQVWWAKRCAQAYVGCLDAIVYPGPFTWRPDEGNLIGKALVLDWRNTPWFGAYAKKLMSNTGYGTGFQVWTPRRMNYEMLMLITGHDFGNDPDAWEAWFKAHPNLVWDKKQKRLVDPTPQASAP